MGFSGGDYIASGMFLFTLVSFALREQRSRNDRITIRAAADANAESLAKILKTELAVLTAHTQMLDEKRQKHEIECARVQERVASTLERISYRLDLNERSISNLNAQMSHIASGGAGSYRELK